MSQQLDEYETEYLGHVSAASSKLEQAERASALEDRKAATAAADRATEAAKDVIQLMELEGRSLPNNARSRMQTKLRSYRSEVADLKARIKDCRMLRASPSEVKASVSLHRQPYSCSTTQLLHTRAHACTQDRIREDLFASPQHLREASDGERARMLASK